MISSHPFFKASVPSRSHASTLLPSILSLFIGAASTCAQTLTTLHSFLNPSEGASPRAGLILFGKTLFGTAAQFSGSVFRLNTDGTGFTNLYTFTGGADGSEPAAPLMLSGDTLYGTTVQGGLAGNGTVFKLSTNGTGFTVLHSFSALTSSTNYDGATPYGGLVLSGNVLYGDAQQGGAYHDGTIFSVNTDGSGFTTLDNTGGGGPGGNPNVGLTLSGSTLYGTASYGGNGNAGAILRLNTDGSDFVALHIFDSNTDGAHPYGSLLLSGNTLYGTTEDGGTSGKGTVFRVNVDGSDFALLHTFSGPDGANPQAQAALILSGNTLYGTTASGGVSNNGTVYAVNADGSGFATLYSFTGSTDGGSPRGALTQSGNTLYGTTAYGGSAGDGTIFALSLFTVSPIRLNFSAQNGRCVWSWTDPTFALQAAPSVTGSWTNVPNASSPYTNSVINSQMFFRLVH